MREVTSATRGVHQMVIFGFLIYLVSGLLALGTLINAFVALAQGSGSSFLFLVGLAVVIGFVGQLVGGLFMAGGMARGSDD